MPPAKKEPVIGTNGTRLVKIVTNGLNEFQRECANCYYYQFFEYDPNGRLISVRDSCTPGPVNTINNYRLQLYENSPFVYTLYYSSNYYRNITYDNNGNLLKATRDSFVYDSRNRVIQRYRRVQCENCPSYLYGKYTYDEKDRLIADSVYTGQTLLRPVTILGEFTTVKYDDNDNAVRIERIGTYPPDSPRYTIQLLESSYDHHTNPFRQWGLIGHFIFNDARILSKELFLSKGYSYEFYPNGLIRKITFNGHTQEYFYQ